MRDPRIDWNNPIHYAPSSLEGGTDVESNPLERPPDCFEYMRNADYPPGWMFGARKGTRLVERFIKKLPDASHKAVNEKWVSWLHHFYSADGNVSRVYSFAGTRIYAKSGEQASVPIREDMDENGLPQVCDFNNLSWVSNGLQQPFIIRSFPYEGGKYYRDVGLPDLSIADVTVRKLRTGNLQDKKRYFYKIALGIMDGQENVVSNCGRDSKNKAMILVDTNEGEKTVVLNNLPIPREISPVNVLYVYRSPAMDQNVPEAVCYYMKMIRRGDREWESGEFTDDGSLDPDLLEAAPSQNNQPPKETQFMLYWLGQMLYFAGDSKVYYSKVGEPEHVPLNYYLTIDQNTGGDLIGACLDTNGNPIVFKQDEMYVLLRLEGTSYLDYRPLGQGVGAMGPKTICKAGSRGIAFLGNDRRFYIWNGSRCQELVNKYGKTMTPVLADVATSALRDSAMCYSPAEDRIYFSYRDPDVGKYVWNGSTGEYDKKSVDGNNCVIVYDFKPVQRWIWPWDNIEAKCWCVLRGYTTAPRVWLGSSIDGCVYELNFGNVDKYCPGDQAVFAPYANSPLAIISGLTDAKILMPRSSAAGGVIYSFNIVGRDASGTVKDNANVYEPTGVPWVGGNLMIGVASGTEAPNTMSRDRIEITYDGGKKLTIFLPELKDPAGAKYYVGSDGSTYLDVALTKVACFNPYVGHAGEYVANPGSVFAPSFDARMGDQIYWECRMGNVNHNQFVCGYPNTAWVVKQLRHMMMQIAPMPLDQYEFSLYDIDNRYLSRIRPKLTQKAGWDYENWDVMLWDVGKSEKAMWEWSADAKSSTFQYRFKYPHELGVLSGGRAKVRFFSQLFRNIIYIDPTTELEEVT